MTETSKSTTITTIDAKGGENAWNYLSIFNNQGMCAVKQLSTMVKAMFGFQTENRYQVYFSNSVKLDCIERSSFVQRCFCSSKREFNISVDCDQSKILRLHRPSFTFCVSPLTVYDAQTDKKLGVVKPLFSFTEKNYHVYVGDESEPKYLITSGVCELFTFHITSVDKSEDLGFIRKTWHGKLKEVFSEADNFGIQFPKECSNEERAVLFGACFLIDIMYFETNGEEKSL